MTELTQDEGAEQLADLLQELAETGALHYVLDVQNIHAMDTACIGCLVEALNYLAARGGRIALVNPEIVGKQGQVEGMEGCLSVPGIEGMVCRGESVTIQGKNESGDPVTIEAIGLLSRVLQHEIDHLDGVLFIDRLSSPTASAK